MKRKWCVMVAFALLLTGCGEAASTVKPTVTLEQYDKMVYQTIDVDRADMVPVVVLKLVSDSYEMKSYGLTYDGMEVDTVFVSEGDSVKKGDVLVSCKAEDITDKIEQYEKQIEQNQMLYDHLTTLNAIDKTKGKLAAIEQLSRTLEVDRMYVEELRAKLSSYSIVAENSGIVLSIADGLDKSTLGKTKNIITVVYGDGIFHGETKEDISFDPNQVYEAMYGNTVFEMQLVSAEDVDDLHKFVFKTVEKDNGFCNKETLTMTIEKPVLKDVLNIPTECISYVDDKTYVYVLDDNGYKDIKEVTIDCIIDGRAIIRSGISEQDKVVIK